MKKAIYEKVELLRNNLKAVEETGDMCMYTLESTYKSFVKLIFLNEEVEELLQFFVKFHNMSFRNVSLLYLQNPNAKQVCSWRLWHKSFKKPLRENAETLWVFKKNDLCKAGFSTHKVFDYSSTSLIKPLSYHKDERKDLESICEMHKILENLMNTIGIQRTDFTVDIDGDFMFSTAFACRAITKYILTGRLSSEKLEFVRNMVAYCFTYITDAEMEDVDWEEAFANSKDIFYGGTEEEFYEMISCFEFAFGEILTFVRDNLYKEFAMTLNEDIIQEFVRRQAIKERRFSA